MGVKFEGKPCQEPFPTVKVWPFAAVPLMVGSDVKFGDWFVIAMDTDQTFVVPTAFVLVVRTVRNLS